MIEAYSDFLFLVVNRLGDRISKIINPVFQEASLHFTTAFGCLLSYSVDLQKNGNLQVGYRKQQIYAEASWWEIL